MIQDPIFVELLRAFGVDCDQWKPVMTVTTKNSGQAPSAVVKVW